MRGFFVRTYLKNPFVPLCGLRGLNITAKDAKKREENHINVQPVRIYEMALNEIFSLVRHTSIICRAFAVDAIRVTSI